jgi:hypothetical protein
LILNTENIENNFICCREFWVRVLLKNRKEGVLLLKPYERGEPK